MSNCSEDFRKVSAFIIILTGFTGLSGFVIIFLPSQIALLCYRCEA